MKKQGKNMLLFLSKIFCITVPKIFVQKVSGGFESF